MPSSNSPVVGYWIGLTGVITSALILAYPQNTAIHFAMYYWAGSVYACQATFFAWANDALRYEEDSLRAVVIASMNACGNAINAWWSIVFYGANFAPYFTRGMWAMIAVSLAMTIWTALLVWQQTRSEKRRGIVGTYATPSGKAHEDSNPFNQSEKV
jgi:ACS family pantothenate transporter-like MFS transporter